jgi:MFS family permease
MFPTFGIKNIKYYYLIGVFSNGWFVVANWLFYYRRFFTDIEVGILDVIGIFLGVIMEIPSGAVSDLLGKKKTLFLAYFLMVVAVFMMTFGDNKLIIAIGNTIMWISFSFSSGTLEAFGFDSLVEKKKEQLYQLVASRYEMLSTFTLIIATAIGGLFYAFSERLPWVMWLLFVTICFIIVFFTKEPSVDTLKFTFKNYFKQLYVGLKGLFSKNLLMFLPIFFITMGMYKLWSEGFLRIAMGEGFGYGGDTFSVVIAITNLIGVALVARLPDIRKKLKDFWGFLILLFILALSFLLSYFEIGFVLGFVVILLIIIVGRFAKPWALIIINENTDSKYRATTISTLALFTQIPFLTLNIFAASLSEANQLNVFFGIIGIFCLLVFVLYGLWYFLMSK